MTNRQMQARKRLREAAAEIERARAGMAEAAREAKRAGVPVAEIAELLGYKTRRSVYQLLEEAETPRTRRVR